MPVTCEVTPHHFVLTEDAVAGYDTDAKMNPPLRSEKDRKALLKGLADGTIVIRRENAPSIVLNPDAGSVESFAFSHDGTRLATSGPDGRT